MNKKTIRFISTLLFVVMLIGMLPALAFASVDADGESSTVYYTAPVIFADAGDTVDLSRYDVMFDASLVTPAGKITWTSGTATVADGKVSVTTAGVTTLTATCGTQTKTVYVVAKEKDDTEYVLYEKDFSTVASWDELVAEGYTVPEKVASHTLTVTDGKLSINGKPNKNITQVILPWWLSDFGDYTFSADVAFSNREGSSRFWAFTYDHQSNTSTGLYPYNFFKFSDPTANDGKTAVGFDRRTAQWSWLGSADGTFNQDTYQKGEFSYSLEKYGTHLTAYSGDTVIHEKDYPTEHANGGMGFLVRGAAIDISSLKITIDKDKLEALYENFVADANPVILADAGQTVDLTKYQVAYAENAVMKGTRLEWSSTDITVTSNTVTPDKAGVYKLSAKPSDYPKTSANVAIGNMATDVYLVVKEKNEKEYVLFEIDYSKYTSLTELTDMGFVVAEQPSGFDISIKNSALAIYGSSTHTGSTMARVMLPEWLGEFGNYTVSADVKYVNAPNTSRYFTLMYRAQNDSNYLPSYVASFRANTTASNGHDINIRYLTSSGSATWDTGVATSGKEVLYDGNFHTLSVSVYGNNIKTYADDNMLIDSDYIGKLGAKYNYNSGMLGYLVRGIDVEIASTRVVYKPAEVTPDMVKTDAPQSNVILPATTVTNVNSKADLDAFANYTTAPANAIMHINNELNVVTNNGDVIADVDSALAALGGRTIPAFYVSDTETADTLCNYLYLNDVIDACVVSDDAEVLKKVRENDRLIRTVLDFSDKTLTEDDLYTVRANTNLAGARVCILPKNLVSKKNVEYLQRLLMAVWVTADSTPAGIVGAVTSGASGIITQDVPSLISAYTDYFNAKTMTRTVGIIGHQGVYTLAQPNTVAGALLAYELGATAIENDIHLSKDGVIIAMHDDTLDRASTGTGKISDYTYEELKQFEVDQHGGADHEPIATLEDYFKAFDGLDAQLIVEIKTNDEAICQKLCDLIREYNIEDQVNVICFNATLITKFKSIMPEMSVGMLCNSIDADEANPENTVYSILTNVQKYDSTYNPIYSAGPLGENVLRASLDRGINVYPYTIDKQADLSTYFLYGSHAITTNYTQYMTDCVKALLTDKSEYVSKTKDIDLTVSTLTYGREQTAVTDAELKFIEGDDIFTYADGKLVASGDGSATLMFSYECKTVANETYYVVTEPFTVTVDSDPEITAEDNKAVLSKDARRVYWGYIGTENTEYKWFNDFMAQCGDTFTSEYAPKANDTYELTRKGFYRFVVNEGGKDYVYTVECTVDSAPAVDMSAENAVATLSGNARKVYFGYIGEENTAYAGFAPFKEICGDTFTADFSPRDNKAYRMEKEGYYRFVVNYLDQNGKSHDKVFTFKCENAGYGIPEVTFADGKITLNSNEANVNKMYIGYFGKDEVEVTSWSEFTANSIVRTCIQTPADSYTTNLKNKGCYVILVNYTDENGKNKDKYFTFNN